jgi:hypothetical protein
MEGEIVEVVKIGVEKGRVEPRTGNTINLVVECEVS